MKTLIRRPKSEDEWKSIQKLNYEVYEASQEHDPYLNMEEPFDEKAEERYKKDITDNQTFFAEIDGEVVGYLVGGKTKWSYRTPEFGEIIHMGVSPQHRSQGIGKKLVVAFKQWCKQQDIHKLYVSTYTSNQKAIRFYKKQGLHPIDISLAGDI